MKAGTRRSVIIVPRRAHAFDAPERQTFPRKEKSLLGGICGSAEPMSVQKCRVKIVDLYLLFSHYLQSDIREHEHDVRFGSKADMCSAKGHVRFTPESDIKCDIWGCPLWVKNGMSALPTFMLALSTSTYWESAAARGKMILISVNSPGSVSTSIEPPCCLTMMS